jgi:predicted kinase
MIISPDIFRFGSEGKYLSSPEASALAWQKCFDLLRSALEQEAESLVLMVGIPGSGKTTWLKNDPYAERLGPQQTIFFDATLTRRVEREPLVQMAAEFKVPVRAVVFLTPIQVCLSRNWARSEDRRVPYPVIARMQENLRNEPVTLEEGFKEIEAIRSV